MGGITGSFTVTTGAGLSGAGTPASPLVSLNPNPSTLATTINTTSGTSIDFSSIPSWVKRITVLFNNVSTNGVSDLLVQLGAGSVTTTGYLGSSTASGSGSSTNNFTSGFGIRNNSGATLVAQGSMIISTLGSNVWVAQACLGNSNTVNTVFSGGSVALAGVLDRLRFTTVSGSDTFDAGSINIMYE